MRFWKDRPLFSSGETSQVLGTIAEDEEPESTPEAREAGQMAGSRGNDPNRSHQWVPGRKNTNSQLIVWEADATWKTNSLMIGYPVCSAIFGIKLHLFLG